VRLPDVLPGGFQTARLVLRPITPSDSGPIFDGYAQDAEVARFLTWRPHRSRGETDAYVAHCLADDPTFTRTYVLAG
jgi:ribosomal-protein-alanine N-acetyltransferase